MQQPLGFQSELAPRLRGHLNSLLTPVIPQVQAAPTSRKTNRGTNIINYAEDLLADDDFLDESDGPRRLTGLRSRNQPDPNQSRDALVEKLSKELEEPVESAGIWRDWMGKQRYGKYDVDANKPSLEVLDFAAPWSSQFSYREAKKLQSQSELPLTLIPIRIDLDIAPHIPAAPLTLPPRYADYGINPTAPEYRQQEQSPPLRLRDYFMWNLFETHITPDDFALGLAYDLDLPQPIHYAMQISAQIRQQSEEYAGVAMHPLFHKTTEDTGAIPRSDRIDMSRDSSQTPALTPMMRSGSQMNGAPSPGNGRNGSVVARATPMPNDGSGINNPDDMYRCVVTLNVNLLNKLYTDKFEWSLLHPPGCAEAFARQTCADLGLSGEWIPAMTHAIYEAVLRLKKEACESGGLAGAGYGGDIDNFALPGQEAGWRYDDEGLGDEWAPSIEILSKEDIQKREDDRERQIRRQRRETARFSSTANVSANAPTPGPTPGGYFDVPDADTPMGRGERSKKKKRFRSLSPLNRAGTPGGQSDSMGFGGIGGGPAEDEKWRWRCSHCEVPGTAVWAIRDGPAGPRTLCNNCGLMYERNKELPAHLLRLHRGKHALTITPYR